MVHTRTEIGDHFQAVRRAFQQIGIDAIAYRGHQHVAIGHGLGQFVARKSVIVRIETHVEKFGHARFDAVQQLGGDDDAWLGDAGMIGHGHLRYCARQRQASRER